MERCDARISHRGWIEYSDSDSGPCALTLLGEKISRWNVGGGGGLLLLLQTYCSRAIVNTCRAHSSGPRPHLQVGFSTHRSVPSQHLEMLLILLLWLLEFSSPSQVEPQFFWVRSELAAATRSSGSHLVCAAAGVHAGTGFFCAHANITNAEWSQKKPGHRLSPSFFHLEPKFIEINFAVKQGVQLCTIFPGIHEDGSLMGSQRDATHLQDREGQKLRMSWQRWRWRSSQKPACEGVPEELGHPAVARREPPCMLADKDILLLHHNRIRLSLLMITFKSAASLTVWLDKESLTIWTNDASWNHTDTVLPDWI